LTWKNFLIKKRSPRDVLIEFFVPLVIAGFTISVRKLISGYNNFVVFFVAYIIGGNCCRFILAQSSKEKE
jgi:hypothetical protein